MDRLKSQSKWLKKAVPSLSWCSWAPYPYKPAYPFIDNNPLSFLWSLLPYRDPQDCPSDGSALLHGMINTGQHYLNAWDVALIIILIVLIPFLLRAIRAPWAKLGSNTARWVGTIFGALCVLASALHGGGDWILVSIFAGITVLSVVFSRALIKQQKAV